jgi:hypothetical protein
MFCPAISLDQPVNPGELFVGVRHIKRFEAQPERVH